MTIVILTGTTGEQDLCVSIMRRKKEDQKEANKICTDTMLQKLWESQLSFKIEAELPN